MQMQPLREVEIQKLPKSSPAKWMRFFGVLCLLSFAAIIRFALGDAFVIGGDDASYYETSRQIVASGDVFAGAKAIHNIYAFRWMSTWLTALTWALWGDGVFVLTLFQQIGAAVLVLMTLLLGSLCTRGKAFWFAGLIACFIPIGIQYTMTLSPDVLMASFTVVSLYLLLKSQHREKQLVLTFLAGAVFSLSYLCKLESLKHCFPLIVLIVFQELRPFNLKCLARRLALFALPLGVVILTDFLMCSFVFDNPFERIEMAMSNMAMWQRMGTVDPSGQPWSFWFYPKRFLFPFGPFAFVIPLSLIGIVCYVKDRNRLDFLIWFFAQLLIFFVGTQWGQIQERMTQVLIPSAAVFAAYGVVRLTGFLKRRPSRWLLKGGVVLALAYVVLCKFDLRFDASPRAQAVCKSLQQMSLATVYVNDDIRYWMRHSKEPAWQGQMQALSQLPLDQESVFAVIREEKRLPPGWEVSEVLYRPLEQANWVNRLARPLRKYRKEYPPYVVVKLGRNY